MTAILLFVAAILGAAIAALSGFDIGSVPVLLLALSVGTGSCGRSIENRSLTWSRRPFGAGICATKLIGNCSKTWYCQRCWMVAWRVAGLTLQQSDSGLHFWRKSFILMAVTGRGTSTFAFQLWIV